MSAHLSTHYQAKRSPLGTVSLVTLAAVVVTGGVWVWAMLVAPAVTRMLVVWGGGAATVVLCVAVAVAAYAVEKERHSRRRITELEAHAAWLGYHMLHLVDDTLPALVKRVREGGATESVLAEVTRPGDSTLQQLLHAVANEIGAAEQRTAAAVAARASMEEEAARLVRETLPALVKRMRADRASVETALAEVTRPTDATLRQLLHAVAHEISVGERAGAAAMAACANAAARVQAQTTRVLAELRELEHRYGDDKVFADLLELDHRVSQMGRLADSIVLLSGGRSGRRWTKPIGMESLLRGAMGRIDAYRRVRLHSTSTSAVVGYAAEGVMHALAELMDNAAAFCAQPSEVHVYVEEEDAGVVITIEDGGLGMRKRERLQAERAVSEPLNLTTLSGTRLGLPVVGRLASKYGFAVNFRPSSRGGTGVVVLVPRQLITQPKPEVAPAPVEASVQSDASTAPAGSALPADDGEAEGGLPKRRRGATLAAASRSAATPVAGPPQEPGPPQEHRDPGARFAAFRQAAAGGDRSSPSPAREEDTR